MEGRAEAILPICGSCQGDQKPLKQMGTGNNTRCIASCTKLVVSSRAAVIAVEASWAKKARNLKVIQKQLISTPGFAEYDLCNLTGSERLSRF